MNDVILTKGTPSSKDRFPTERVSLKGSYLHNSGAGWDEISFYALDTKLPFFNQKT